MYKTLKVMAFILILQTQATAQNNDDLTLELDLTPTNQEGEEPSLQPPLLNPPKSVLEPMNTDKSDTTDIPLNGPNNPNSNKENDIEFSDERTIEPLIDVVIEEAMPKIESEPFHNTDTIPTYSRPSDTQQNILPTQDTLELVSSSGPFYIFKSDFHPKPTRAPNLYPVTINQKPVVIRLMKQGKVTEQITQGFADEILSAYLNSVKAENSYFASIEIENVSILYLNTYLNSSGKLIYLTQNKNVSAYAGSDQTMVESLFQEANEKMKDTPPESFNHQNQNPFTGKAPLDQEFSSLDLPDYSQNEVTPITPEDIAPGELDPGVIDDFFRNQN